MSRARDLASNAPALDATGNGSASNSIRTVTINAPVAGSVQISCRDGANNRVENNVHVMAVGRWY